MRFKNQKHDALRQFKNSTSNIFKQTKLNSFMSYPEAILKIIKEEFPVIRLIIIVLVLVIAINISLSFVKKNLLKRAKSKVQISNIKIFTRILGILSSILIIVFAFFSYMGSWTSLGIVAGLLTAALGFALQRPITGIAAWLMIVIKRPFNIGDRVMIGDIRGEVYDISLTHLYIDEIGGTIESDDFSGRNVMIPNYLLFENNIINYTLIDDYVLGEIILSITYESSLDKAIKIAEESTEKFLKEHIKEAKRDVKIRVAMDQSSINLKIRFFAPIKIMQRTKSDITTEILKKITKEKDVEIAYPHTEIIFKDKKLFKRN